MKNDRLRTLRTFLRLTDLLLAARQPMTMRDIAGRAGIGLRSAYRYVEVMEDAYHPRLLCTDTLPKRYWMDK